MKTHAWLENNAHQCQLATKLEKQIPMGNAQHPVYIKQLFTVNVTRNGRKKTSSDINTQWFTQWHGGMVGRAGNIQLGMFSLWQKLHDSYQRDVNFFKCTDMKINKVELCIYLGYELWYHWINWAGTLLLHNIYFNAQTRDNSACVSHLSYIIITRDISIYSLSLFIISLYTVAVKEILLTSGPFIFHMTQRRYLFCHNITVKGLNCSSTVLNFYCEKCTCTRQIPGEYLD